MAAEDQRKLSQKGGGGIRCPASFSYRNLFFTHLLPYAFDVGVGLVVFDDLRLSDIRDLKTAGDLPDPPGTFLFPPDLLDSGRFDDLDLWPSAETIIENGQKNKYDCYFKNVIYDHKTTPCSAII